MNGSLRVAEIFGCVCHECLKTIILEVLMGENMDVALGATQCHIEESLLLFQLFFLTKHVQPRALKMAAKMRCNEW